MSTVTHGMNLEEVEALGRLLQSKANELRHLPNDLESALGRTIWEGTDALRFKQQWWPDHKGRLHTVAEQVHGFGQSALNNTTEQRQASGVAPTQVGAAAAAVVGASMRTVASSTAGGRVVAARGEDLPDLARLPSVSDLVARHQAVTIRTAGER